MCSVEFQAIQGGYEKFPVGIYGVVAQWKEQSIQSEPVSIMEAGFYKGTECPGGFYLKVFAL